MKLMRFDELPDLLTVEELAGFLRINRNTAYESVRAGTIPSVKLGARGPIRIPKQAVARMMEGRENGL